MYSLILDTLQLSLKRDNRGTPLTRESLRLTTNSALFSVAHQHTKTRCGLPKRSNVVTAALNKSIGGLVKANVESLTHVRTILLSKVSNASARS